MAYREVSIFDEDFLSRVDVGDEVIFHDRSARYGGKIIVQGTVTTKGKDHILIKNDQYHLKRHPGYWRARLSTDTGKTIIYIPPNNEEYGKEPCECEETFNNNEKEKESSTMNVIAKAKNIALKVTNPNEYALRKANLHNDCGDLTEAGKEILWSILEEANKDAFVAQANALIEADKEDKE